MVQAPSRSYALSRPLNRSQLHRGTQHRIFTTGGGPLSTKHPGSSQADKKPPSSSLNDLATKEAPKNNAVENLKAASKKPDELGGNTITAKQQRKVDWAIMKEMAKYLWPKVSGTSRTVLI